jgi:hypothetical protein
MSRAALLGLAACGTDPLAFYPVVDLPANDSASAFPVDKLIVSVAHEGSDDLFSKTFQHGQTVDLPAIDFGADLVLHMKGRRASSDVAYGRTCSFEIGPGKAVPSPHLYFSRLAKFGQLSYMPELRRDGAAIAYHDDSILLMGGLDPNDETTPILGLERFDPRTGLFQPVDSPSLRTRRGAVAAQLGTGTDMQIALVGGADPTTNAGAEFFELVDVEAAPDSRVQVVPDMSMSRVDLTATSLNDGRVIVIGGVAPGLTTPSNAVDEISLDLNSQPVVHQLQATLAIARSGHTATHLGSDVGAPVLIAGGIDASGMPVATAELFKPLFKDFSTDAPMMKIPRSHHQTVRMPDGSALVIGGIDAAGTPVSALELFSLDVGFQLIGPACSAGDTCPSGAGCPTSGPTKGICAVELPADAGLVDFTATTLADGGVLLAGGSRTLGGDPLPSAFLATLDPLSGLVDILKTDYLAVPRSRHQATLMCDGTVLLSGGTTSPVVVERYNPSEAGRR